MIREVEDNVEVIDQFPAFESDGYSKRSGLAGPDFNISVFRDGAEYPVPVFIEEIGSTGEYKVRWTPPFLQLGYYHLQVLIDFNKDMWGGWYNVVDQLTHDILVHIQFQGDKIDLIPTLGPNAVTSGSLMDRMMNKDSTKTYNPATDSLQALRDRSG